MIGLPKVAASGFGAAIAVVTMAGAVHASQPAQAPAAAPANGACQATGNQLIGNVSFATASGTHADLHGNVVSGDHVVATFTVPANCSVEAALVAYRAPGGTYDANTASQQTVFDARDDTFGAGQHSMAVTAPGCYFQVDLVRGSIITKLGPNGSSNFYGAQGRLISAANGGSHSCTSGETTCSASAGLGSVSYLLGGTTTVTDLRGHVASGQTVKATFTVPVNCSMQLSLAAYRAPLPYFTRASAPQQKLVDSQTGTFASGVNSMQVTVPSCMFQVDFVHGAVLTTLGTTASTDYEDRLISADNGGTTSCTDATPTPTPTPTPTATPTPTGTPTATPTPTATATATPKTTPTATPTIPTSTGSTHTPAPGGVLAASISTPSTGSNLGAAAGAAVIVILLGFVFLAVSGFIRRDDAV